jgi:SAM-dependent methyltransferase
MMFGGGDEFAYVECAACGCLQIAEVPTNLADYYPTDYYAFQPQSTVRRGAIAEWFKRHWARYSFGRWDPLGRLLSKRYGPIEILRRVNRAGVSPSDAVLDVGSGIGLDLLELRRAGFRDLTGIDPYITSDIHYPNGIRIFRRDLANAEGEYSLIISNHSFEHMPEPLEALRHVRRLLSAGGAVLIRIPVADSHAWRTYGAEWVQLDCPRHLFLHTRRSMEVLADAAGLRVDAVVWDSTAFQFWGSEQYQRGIPLYHARSYLIDPAASPFTRDQIDRWEEEAEALNRIEEGDQACFYLRKAGTR